MRDYCFLAPKAFVIDGKRTDVKRFGQSVSLSDDDVRFIISSRGFILTADAFNAIGFKPEDLRRFADVRNHDKATPEFLEKKDKAISAARAEMDAFDKGEVDNHA